MKIFILFAFLLSGCTSMTLRPYQGELKKTFTEPTKLSKQEAYEKTLVWLSKTIKDSNEAIKMKDLQLGRIVAKVTYPCKGLKRPDVVISIDSTDVAFNIDVAAKDKIVKYELEMTGFKRDLGSSIGSAEYFIAEDKGQKEAVEVCFENLKNHLRDSLK